MVKASPPKERGGLRLSFFVGVGVGLPSVSLGALECPSLRREADLDPMREGKGGGRRCENSPTHMERWATQQEQQQPQGGGGKVQWCSLLLVVWCSFPPLPLKWWCSHSSHLLLLGKRGGADAPSVLVLFLSPSLCVLLLFCFTFLNMSSNWSCRLLLFLEPLPLQK